MRQILGLVIIVALAAGCASGSTGTAGCPPPLVVDIPGVTKAERAVAAGVCLDAAGRGAIDLATISAATSDSLGTDADAKAKVEAARKAVDEARAKGVKADVVTACTRAIANAELNAKARAEMKRACEAPGPPPVGK